MTNRNFWMPKVSKSLILLGFLLTNVGFYFRSQAPQFEAWLSSLPNVESMGIGVFVYIYSPFTAILLTLFTLINFGGLLLMWGLAERTNAIAKFFTLSVAALFLVIAYAITASAWDSLRWKFYTVALELHLENFLRGLEFYVALSG
ncbi:MAG: hypothetical protein ACFB5Z_19275 [Elainellaceae cyanobacterium]